MSGAVYRTFNTRHSRNTCFPVKFLEENPMVLLYLTAMAVIFSILLFLTAYMLSIWPDNSQVLYQKKTHENSSVKTWWDLLQVPCTHREFHSLHACAEETMKDILSIWPDNSQVLYQKKTHENSCVKTWWHLSQVQCTHREFHSLHALCRRHAWPGNSQVLYHKKTHYNGCMKTRWDPLQCVQCTMYT